MSLVDVHNEWDPLEEVIVGTAVGARLPQPDFGLYALEYADLESPQHIPTGAIDPRVIAETEQELENLCSELTRLGIVVRRPEPRDLAAVVSTPQWSSDGFYDYCPRDGFLTVGDTIIETPMVLRSRFLEGMAYRRLFLEYLDSGARWLSAPKPVLPDEMFDPRADMGSRLGNLEPAFDAANVLRLGTDLLYLLSDSGNERGLRWLQSTVGDAYTVHACADIYASTHVDSTIVPLRPGLVLLNPERINDRNMPDVLRSWDHIWAPEMVDIGCTGRPHASTWIGMNLLMLRPDLAVADARQPELLRLLEKNGIDVLPMTLTHARTLGGGFHCVSLDVRRRGELETYR
ncbi:MAG TPA: scyllo-inosamine-4-phosphate amidinotransferase [Actinoplanes sp.]|nr:scyllo-inosamine-4-phosphate amidinotransferase [Actinoplanes sp.]